MKYEVYCDESCVEALFNKTAHRYAAIGSVWIPAENRKDIKSALCALKEKYGKRGEMKWKKISPSTEAMYCELIDLFFGTYQVRFRAICIEAEKINHVDFNSGSGELGFYKFYFQLIQHWLVDGNEYNIYLDHKINGNPHRVHELKRILQNSTTAYVIDAQALPSEQSALIQLADVLTGAVSASFNRSLSGSKAAVVSKIEQYIGHSIGSTGVTEQKFNVFDINLRRGW